VSKAVQIVTLCCCVVSSAACYTPEIAACQVTCAEAGGECPEGTSCSGGFCNPPGVLASTCRGGVDGGPAGGDAGDFVVPDDMVLISNTQAFSMGCAGGVEPCEDNEEPVHIVHLSDYLIDKTEVTVGAYADCVSAMRCAAPTASDTAYYRPETNPDWPVTGMNRETAAVYCAYRMKRLPTEAEWEKAARGTEAANVYPWGPAIPGCYDRAQFQPEGVGCSHLVGPEDVGSFPTTGANEFGLMDMSGNVWEWVSDWNGDYSIDEVTDPQGPETAPAGESNTGILRGAGWGTGYEESLRVANRHFVPHTSRTNTYGMRCARDVP
jgi:formylglycine-generating enzyme required for sulfatase activity